MTHDQLAVDNIQLLIKSMQSLKKFTVCELVADFKAKNGNRSIYIGTQTIHEFLDSRVDFGLLNKVYDMYSL